MSAAAPASNVGLVTIDSRRADAIGPYDGDRHTPEARLRPTEPHSDYQGSEALVPPNHLLPLGNTRNSGLDKH